MELAECKENRLTIDSISKNGGVLSIEYTVDGEWKKYFSKRRIFNAYYDIDLSDVPDAVAVVPFVGDIIVMASIFQGKIYLTEIDEDFLNSVPGFIAGFKKMYPSLDFKADEIIMAKSIKKSKNQGNKSLLFFSGGVDAYSSLVTHLDEKPFLLTVWGADIGDNDEITWNGVKRNNIKAAQELELPLLFIRSNFRVLLDHEELSRIKEAENSWWHNFHHSVAVISLAAPYALYYGIRKIYFASTYTNKDYDDGAKLASAPFIDNEIRFVSASVLHDGVEFNRYEKERRIIEYVKASGKKIKLHVCYQNKDKGENCCKCEKCIRTIIPILLEHEIPQDYGFKNYNKDTVYGDLVAAIKEKCLSPGSIEAEYGYIQKRFREAYQMDEVPDELKLLYVADLKDIDKFMNARDIYYERWKELSDWCVELTAGKNWLEEKYNEQNRVIEELKKWNEELMAGKNWLEERYNEQGKIIEELKGHLE